MRRGELCGLQWSAVDLDQATISVERSLEETDAGVRLKSPRSRHGRRRIALPASVVEVLRARRVRQIELRLALGMGRLGPDDFVFGQEDGSPLPPDRLSQQWRRVADTLGLTGVSFHALRHTCQCADCRGPGRSDRQSPAWPRISGDHARDLCAPLRQH